MHRRRSAFDTRVCWIAFAAFGCALPQDLPTDEEEPSGGSTSGGSGGGGASGGSGTAGKSFGGFGTNGGSLAGGTGGTTTGGTTGGSTTGGTATGGTTTGGSTTGGTSSAGKGGASGQAGSAGKGGTASGGTGGTPSGGAPGTELFFDDFESGAGKWVAAAPAADWSVVADGDQVYQQSAKTNNFRMTAASAGPWGNQAVEVEMKIVSIVAGSTSYYAAICGRVQDANNFYYIAVRANGTLVIRARKGGSHGNLTDEADSVITPGTWHTLRLEMVGSTIRALVDGAIVAQATDTAITMGTVGLSNVNASVAYDDVRVTVP